MKSRRVLLFLASILLLLVACSGDRTGSGDGSDAKAGDSEMLHGDKLYADTDFGYSVRYPADWSVDYLQFTSVFTAPDGNASLIVAAGIQNKVDSGETAIESAVQQFLDDTKNQDTEIEIVSREDAEGFPGEVLQIKSVVEGEEIETTAVFAHNGRRVLYALGAAGSDEKDHHKTLSRILESFSPFEELPEDDYGDDFSNASALEVGDQASGTLSWYGDLDFFSFDAEAGTTYQSEVELLTLEDSFLTLYTPMGDCPVSSNDNHAQDSGASLVSWRVVEDGTYYLAVGNSPTKVRGYSTSVNEHASAGEYILHLETTKDEPSDDHGGQTCSATPISPGDSVEGDLNDSVDEDWFGFQVEPGQGYSFEIELGSLERAFLNVRSPQGVDLTTFVAGLEPGSGIQWTAPSSFPILPAGVDPDRYYVTVRHYGIQEGVEKSGDYSLSMSSR